MEEATFLEKFEDTRCTVLTYGKPYNFRLLFSGKKEYAYQPEKRARRESLLKMLAEQASSFGITRVIVPHVYQFNAELGKGSLFDTNEKHGSIGFSLGEYFADGVILDDPRDSALIITGDCPTVVAWDATDPVAPVVAAHAGRESLHNAFGNHAHGHESVIDEIIAHFGDPHNIRVRIIAGIGPEHFIHAYSHPTQGKTNRLLIPYLRQKWGFGVTGKKESEGHIDLAELIRVQFISHNARPENISSDNVDTYTNLELYSNRAEDGERNGILVLPKP